MLFNDIALVVAAAGLLPIMVTIAYFDLRDLRIPNWSVLAVLGVFLATGSWGLPFDVFLWRLLYGVIAFALGFALYSVAAGQVGAGDLKLLAVLVPFIAGASAVPFMLVYALLSIVGLGVYLLAQARLKGRQTGLRALDQRIYFPAGILLGLTMSVLLCAELYGRFAA